MLYIITEQERTSVLSCSVIIAARLVDKYWQALLFASHASQTLPVLRVTIAARLVDNLTTVVKLFLGHEHRVPGGKHCRLLVKDFKNICRDILLVYNQTEHVFIEPFIGHYECAVES